MNKRIIPVSGEELPVIGVGTWQTFDIAGKGAYEPREQVLKLLTEKGGNMIDSSPMYGRSEKVVGDLLKKTGLSKSVFLATKVWTNGKEAAIKQMNNSFELLKAGTIDLMQIHNLVDWKTHLPILKEWKESGRIRYAGITHYHESAYDQVEQVMKSEQVDFLQINYSITRREAEERILPLASDKGVAVIINQPFESGSLFSRVRGKALPDFACEFDCSSWAQYFLKFILSHEAVTCVIPGTSNPAHLADHIKAGYGRLPDTNLRKRMLEYMSS